MKKLLYTILVVSIILSACKKEENEPTETSNNTSISIGNYHQGGVIFYLDGNGSGLICDISDIATSLSQAEWGCDGDSLDAAGIIIGTGFSNTTKIINGCNESGIAAEICYNLSKSGYTDWYLPSEDELKEIYSNKNIINTTSTANGGFNLYGGRYWSSTEAPISSENAITVDFEEGRDGYVKGNDKSRIFNVRAIRSF